MFNHPSPEAICAELGAVKTIAVLGLSPRPDRPSHRVARAMQSWGFRIIPVRPGVTEVLGERAYAHLADVPESIAIDLVDVFRAAEHAPAIVEECIALGVPRLWFQQGIFHEAACARAREAGIFVVADRCLMVDYASHCRKDS